MKQFKKLLPAIALIIAVISSLAFRPVEKKNYLATLCVWYDFVGVPGQEHDPSKYVLAVSLPPSCPGVQIMCAICVYPTEIYDDASFPVAYRDKPMVDDVITNIYSLIDYALSSPKTDVYEYDFNNNIVDAVELKFAA